ncbi:MAG: hypothetical protein HN390_02905 [Anaerolineae bacterium]|jgi:hypothetical protein|nr:hypothetical protein [Anaerolineae bacterium]MBT7190656.1 hypothetical protein [Anaerolineae bacterium]MBT7990558.1 hypothetical protein [Anaerolineae bacterium]
MKTQIIQLEPHDNHISIRDKMNWSKTPRILLVLPRRGKFDLNTLDLKLLQRYAKSLGAELGLVTKSTKVIRAADVLNISVFESNLAAQRESWHLSVRKKYREHKASKDLREKQKEFRTKEAKWRNHPLTRLAFFSLGVLALLMVIVAFLPRAEVVLVPEKRVQSLIIPVRANADITEIFLSGSIPAQRARVILTESTSAGASGRIAVPAKNARGTVIFHNLTDSPVQIPAGTIIRSLEDEEIRFETMDNTKIEGGVDAEVEVRVEALIFGERGNLDPNLLEAIEGDLGLSLAATNPNPIEGGSDDFVLAPSTQDRSELRDRLMVSFYQQAEEKIAEELSTGDLLFPNAVSEAEIIEEIYDPPPGESGDRLTLSVSVEFEIQFAKGTDLAELAQSALDASLPTEFSPVPNTLRFEHLSDFENNAPGITSWQMRVEQDLRPIITPAQIAALTQGCEIEVATQSLKENFELAEPPTITVTPSWWKWMPIAPFRIELVLK